MPACLYNLEIGLVKVMTEGLGRTPREAKKLPTPPWVVLV